MNKLYLKLCNKKLIDEAIGVIFYKMKINNNYLKNNKNKNNYIHLSDSLLEDLNKECYKPSNPQKDERPYSHNHNKILYFDRLNIRDKIVEQAIKIVLSPIYENIALPFVCSYRPLRGIQYFSNRVKQFINDNYFWFICVDIEKYFYSINTSLLEKQLIEITKDEKFVNLIFDCLFLNINSIGIPLGHIISPLLSNIYLHPIDYSLKDFSVLRYGDNYFFIKITLTNHLNEIKIIQNLLYKRDLKLNNSKTRILFKPNYKDLLFN